jgi:hypothetical protein
MRPGSEIPPCAAADMFIEFEGLVRDVNSMVELCCVCARGCGALYVQRWQLSR